MWMKGKHAFVLIFRNGLLKDSFEGFEVEEGINIIVDKIDIAL
jgi:hypothetical protein